MVSNELLSLVLTMTQDQVQDFVLDYLGDGYEVVSNEHGIIARNKLASDGVVTLVAHLDTINDHDGDVLVMDDLVVEEDRFSLKDGLSKVLGADCRAGLALALTLSKELPDGSKPHLVFPRNEEVGGIGAYGMVKEKCALLKEVLNTHALIELDRRNEYDYVTYHYHNNVDHPVIQLIESLGYEEVEGSFTDIVAFDPMIDSLDKTAVFNLSIGYYHAHTPKEYLDLFDYQQSYDTLSKIVSL